MKKIFIALSLILISFVSRAQNQYTPEKIQFESIDAVFIEPERVFEKPPIDTSHKLSATDVAAIEADKEILKKVPKNYDNLSPTEMKSVAQNLENQLQRLIKEKEALLKSGASPEVIESKNSTINGLNKEKTVVNLTIDKENLKIETTGLKSEKKTLKNYLIVASVVLILLILALIVLIQRKTIKVQDLEIDQQVKDINRKNNYLEHASRIIRHDMHSGINTYMPRGLSSLEKRISEEEAKKLKIDGSIKMIKEGLSHTQKVYKSVYEFTNLVKPNSILDTKEFNLGEELSSYLSTTSYKGQVQIDTNKTVKANPFLFCTAVDNLIRNGLKFNTSENKFVKVYSEENAILIEDNGTGLGSDEFKKIRNNENEEGLGLNICVAIIEEHGFDISCEKIETGTLFKIHI